MMLGQLMDVRWEWLWHAAFCAPVIVTEQAQASGPGLACIAELHSSFHRGWRDIEQEGKLVVTLAGISGGGGKWMTSFASQPNFELTGR